jgi:cytochrome c oxidase cbb3-type subunit IV
MTDYESWRQFAAGWGLFYFVAMFTLAMIYAFLPSRKKVFDEAARIPLRDD